MKPASVPSDTLDKQPRTVIGVIQRMRAHEEGNYRRIAQTGRSDAGC